MAFLTSLFHTFPLQQQQQQHIPGVPNAHPQSSMGFQLEMRSLLHLYYIGSEFVAMVQSDILYRVMIDGTCTYLDDESIITCSTSLMLLWAWYTVNVRCEE